MPSSLTEGLKSVSFGPLHSLQGQDGPAPNLGILDLEVNPQDGPK